MKPVKQSCSLDTDPIVWPCFFRLVHIALGAADAFDRPLSGETWAAVMNEAERQSLLGVCWKGVERLPASQLPPRALRGEWYVLTERLREENARQRRQCEVVVARFAAGGMRAAVLKGQAMARLYPDPTLRAPGDIDLWVEGGRRRLADYARRLFPGMNVDREDHHIQLPVLTDTLLEAHFTPLRLSNPLHDARMQRFFKREAGAVFAHRVRLAPEGYETCVPTTVFDRVYVLAHIFRHLFAEGVGLRQVLDYRQLLLCPLSAEEERLVAADIRALGLRPALRAVLGAITAICPVPHGCLPDVPDEKRGRFLLREAMMTGNFGKYERRWMVDRSKSLRARWYNMPRLVSRWLRLLRWFPAEALFEPWARLSGVWRRKFGFHPKNR